MEKRNGEGVVYCFAGAEVLEGTSETRHQLILFLHVLGMKGPATSLHVNDIPDNWPQRFEEPCTQTEEDTKAICGNFQSLMPDENEEHK